MLLLTSLGCAAHRPAPIAPTGAVRIVAVERRLGLDAVPSFEGVTVSALAVATWPGGWRWPVDGVVSSAFGPRWGRLHQGLDVAAPAGTPVFAARGGRVVRAGSYGDLGLMVELDHGGGWTSRYGHLSVVDVAVGDRADGVVLGRVGATGNATGPHLHWEIRKDGAAVDPMCALEPRCVARVGR